MPRRKAVVARSKAKVNGTNKRKGVNGTRTAKVAGSDRNILVASLKAVPPKRSRASRTSTPARNGRSPRHGRSVPQLRPTSSYELVSNARAAAHSSSHRFNRHVSIMDVVLDAQGPNRRLDIEDLRDAIEECHRVALSIPASDEDELLANMFVPGRYEARQAFLAEDVQDLAEDFTPKEIYQVSAERSTATWEPSLDSESSDDNLSLES